MHFQYRDFVPENCRTRRCVVGGKQGMPLSYQAREIARCMCDETSARGADLATQRRNREYGLRPGSHMFAFQAGEVAHRSWRGADVPFELFSRHSHWTVGTKASRAWGISDRDCGDPATFYPATKASCFSTLPCCARRCMNRRSTGCLPISDTGRWRMHTVERPLRTLRRSAWH